MRPLLFTFILLISLIEYSPAQEEVPYNDDNTVDLYAQTKQINQFMRRFNGEENAKGERYYESDRDYRDADLREKYLNILFDLANFSIGQNDKTLFIQSVLNENNPKFLDISDKDWWAEVDITFLYNFRRCDGKIFLEIEEENEGLKWSIRSVSIPAIMPLDRSTPPDTSINFLHPLSHELDFMNLEKVFENPEYIDLFIVKDFEKDPLTIFTELIRKGELKFQSVRQVKFHMYQIENWYFVIREFNRSGLNKGYLISDLYQLQESSKQEHVTKMLNGKI